MYISPTSQALGFGCDELRNSEELCRCERTWQAEHRYNSLFDRASPCISWYHRFLFYKAYVPETARERVAWKRAGYDAAELQGDGRITASQLGYFILRSWDNTSTWYSVSDMDTSWKTAECRSLVQRRQGDVTPTEIVQRKKFTERIPRK